MGTSVTGCRDAHGAAVPETGNVFVVDDGVAHGAAVLETGSVNVDGWVAHGAEVEARLAAWWGVLETMLVSDERTWPLESGFGF